MSLYSIPNIFHQSIGFPDTPDYIRVCAHNKDTKEAVLRHLQSSPQEMLYGPFKEITFDSQCNVNPDRTHWKLVLPVPGPQQSQSPETSPTP